MDIQKYEIIFINDFATPLLSAAFDAVCSFENLTAKRLDALEVISRYQSKVPKRVSFVLCRFEGDCFEHLRSIGAAIYGPQIILHYVRENKALPKVSHPLFSTALMGTIATVTSVTGSEREYLFNSIQMLHGEASRDLFDGVNVVITPKVGSKKYLVGSSRGLHVLLPSWIAEAWRLSAIQDPIDMLLPSYTERFRVPVFCQLVICVSGLSSEERKEVSDLVVKHGGRYSGMMKVGETTHLIIKQTGGLKYAHAKKWKIQIVSLRWLTDSVSKGYALDEEDYRVSESGASSSTPTSESAKHSISFNNISAISHATIARIDETRTDYIPGNSSLNPCKIPVTPRILSDCVIALLGCSVEETTLYTMLVDELGGRLCAELHEQVSDTLTHFVVGTACQNTFEFNREKDVMYVRGSWLVECKNASCRLPESGYLLTAEVPNDDTMKPHTEPTVQVNQDDLSLINQYFASDEVDDFTHPVSERVNSTKKSVADVSQVDEISTLTESGVFSGHKFAFHNELPPKERNEAQKIVIDGGGSLVDYPATCSFLITPFVVKCLPNLPVNCKAVTLHWIDMCYSESKLLLDCLQTGNGFVPISHEPPLPLDGCVISLSGFVGKNRNFLTAYAQALGAVVQDCFLRKSVPSRKLSASTHLVAAKRDGRKWPAAQSWNLPAVSQMWLFACAEQWGRVNESDYPVPINSESVHQLKDSTTLEEPKPNQPKPSTQHNTFPKLDNVLNTTPSLQLNISSNPLKTPDWVSVGRASDATNMSHDSTSLLQRPSPPMSEQVARCLRKAVNVTAALPKRKLDLSENEQPDPLPLRGVVICVAKHLSARQVELNGVAKQLGGDFKWIYDPQVCTHLVAEYLSDRSYSSETDLKTTLENQQPVTPNDGSTLFSDVNAAKNDGKHIVHPDWLNACLSVSCRLPEHDFPPSDRLLTRVASSPSEFREPSRKMPRIASSDLLGDVHRRLEQVLGSCPKTTSEDCLSGEIPHSTDGTSNHGGKISSPLLDISNNFNCDDGLSFLGAGLASRRPRRNVRRPTTQSADEGCGTSGTDYAKYGGGAAPDVTVTKETSVDRAQPGQSLMVRWQYEDAPSHSPCRRIPDTSCNHTDPTPSGSLEKPEKTSTDHEFAVPKEPAANVTRVDAALPATNDKSVDEAVTKKRIFSFSGLSPDARDHYASVVSQLGGEVDNQMTISEETTHLVVHTPTRSEKYLICLATGKWILHKSYLDACLRESRWVDESSFEWGGPGTEPLLMQLSPAPLANMPHKANARNQQAAQIRELAKAARYWRIAGGKAFQNWRVIFGPGCDKETSFRRVIEAGGGQVLTSGPPYPPVANVSHAFYKKRPNASDPVNQLPEEYGWLRIDYLSAYLVTGHEVSREEFALNGIGRG